MGETNNTLYALAVKFSSQAGRHALKGMGIGRDPASPRLFAAGNVFYGLAAGINGQPVQQPEYFEPQNYRNLNVELIPTQPIAERQGE